MRTPENPCKLPEGAIAYLDGGGAGGEIGQLRDGKLGGFAHRRVAVAGVASRAEPAWPDAGKHLLHHLAEIGRRQRLNVDPCAVGSIFRFVGLGGERLQNAHISAWSGVVAPSQTKHVRNHTYT